MRTASLILLGAAGYAAFLVATVPASFVAAQAGPRVRDVRIHEAHGTLWHGAARAEVNVGSTWLPVESLAWRLEPAALLRGRLAFAVDAQASGATAQGTVARGLSKWHAAGRASAPASFAATVVPLLSTWRPEGRLELRTDAIAWDEREASGDVLAEWREAAVALSQVRPLGHYRATLHAAGTSGKFDLATIEGPLRVTGQGELALPSRVTFNGEARGEGPSAAALDPLLDLMGPRRPDGARALAWRQG